MTDFELRNALFELSGLRSDAEPIVTLYLDTHWSDEKQRERARVFVNEAVKRGVDRHIAHPQLEAMKRTLRRVAQAAAANHGQPGEGEGQGLAVFACESLGLWRVIASPRAFRDELSVDGRAHLLQLARLADHVQPAVIVLVHGRGAQLYEVALGAIVNETSIEGPVPNRHGEGDRVRAAASPRRTGRRAARTSSARRRTSAMSTSSSRRCTARRPTSCGRSGSGIAERTSRSWGRARRWGSSSACSRSACRRGS